MKTAKPLMEPKTTYTLTIPNWRPPRLNDVMGKTWKKAWRKKNETRSMLEIYARGQGVPAATGKRRVRLSITYCGRQQARDADAMDKLLLDAMVRCGLLTDDDANGIEGRVEIKQERGEKTQTVIELEEAE